MIMVTVFLHVVWNMIMVTVFLLIARFLKVYWTVRVYAINGIYCSMLLYSEWYPDKIPPKKSL